MSASNQNSFRITISDLHQLFDKLKEEDYTQIGPVARDGAIMLEEISSFDDLAVGYHEKQDRGKYELTHSNDGSYFQYTLGPQSFKKFLHPPKRKLWEATGNKHSFQVSFPDLPPKMAFWGVRNCDLMAISILDKIYLEGTIVNEWYKAARNDLFIVAVGCTHPSDNCFCTTMEGGPKPFSGYDVSLIENKSADDHFLLAEIPSEKAQELLDTSLYAPASAEDERHSLELMQTAFSKMEERFDPEEVSLLLKDNLEHPHWEEVANKCLSCANCTMVCPTCFCTTTEDITDVTGDHTERWLRWDSCFNGDFSYIHGGQIRTKTKSRYRQWITHKLSNWYDQFGSSGCVGCGRCITWCPVGIDITEEVKKIQEKAIKQEVN